MIDRFLTSLAALSLASLVWLYARSRDQDTMDNVPIPVQIALAPGLADQYELDVPDACHVPVSFTGPPSRIRELRHMLNHGELRVEITLNIPERSPNESRFEDTVRVDAADIKVQVPVGVTPMVVEGRNLVPVTIYRLDERRLPVRFNHLTEERVGSVTLEPATVWVRGPREVLDRIRAIPTQPYTLSSAAEAAAGRDKIVKETVPLVRKIEGRAIQTAPAAVTASLTVRPRQMIYELPDVPVQFLCPASFPLRPQFQDAAGGKVRLRVRGPAGNEPPPVTVYIDLGRRPFEAGLYTDEPLRLQLPKDFQLAQDPPRAAPFRLSPLEGDQK